MDIESRESDSFSFFFFYSEQVDLIRQVMSGITLPTSAVPEWAKVVPEEKWKASLVSSIENRTTSPPGSAKID